MKFEVMDSLKRRTLEGCCIDIIPANAPIDVSTMRRVWKTVPGHRMYSVLAHPQPYERLVMQTGDDEDVSFYVLPRTNHHYLKSLDKVRTSL